MQNRTIRARGVFASTKVGLQSSVDLIVDTIELARQELNATKQLNAVEHAVELKSAKIQGVLETSTLTTEAYQELAKIDALPIPDDVKEKLKAQLLEAIA